MVIYIHIPFCIKKCDYCDFLSGPYNEEIRNKYVDCLINEINYHGTRYGTDGRNIPVTSVFFGGGTPSLLEGLAIARIIKALRDNFTIEETAEITVECNPGTIERQKLLDYGEAGVNRLSIGLQSANDDELKSIGRIHTYQEFLESYSMARETGFTNINIDLMSALPNQTIDSYKETLKKIINLKPEHISAYSLILEEGTCLYERISALENNGQATGIPDEDTEREMYYVTKKLLLAAGYERYEISNYAKEGYNCRHNMAYWMRDDYIGMGLGASSCMDGVRTRNVSDMKKYMEITGDIQVLREVEGVVDSSETDVLTDADKMAEFMFLGLRMTDGVSKNQFEKYFGVNYNTIYGGVTEKLIKQKLLEEYNEGDRIRLTELGVDVSNSVMAEFLLD